MPWKYIDAPEHLEMPACPHCRNRLGVSCFAPNCYFCADCRRAFVAVWRRDEPQKTDP